MVAPAKSNSENQIRTFSPVATHALFALFLVGFTTKERPKSTESRTRLVILPNSFVPVVWGIEMWCNIKHALPQLKLALTSQETTWESTLGLISSSFLVAGSIYLKRTIEWWHRRNQAPKIKVGRSRRLPLTPCSLWFLVGFTT